VNVEELGLDALMLDPANVRKHSPRNIETIKGSLARWGQQKPIVIDKDGVVVAGNGTVEAARLLGWQTIRVVRTTLKGSDRTAYAIADNRSAELAEWDDGLAAALASLQQDGVLEDVEVTGFTEAEIAALIAADLEPPSVTEDAVPEVPVEAVTQPGDLWVCGEHRVLCGDSTKVENVVCEAAPSFVLTSPPYGAGIDYGKQSDDSRKANKRLAATMAAKLLQMVASGTRAAIQTGYFIVDQNTKERGFLAFEWQAAMLEAGWLPMDCAIWDKGASGSTAWGSYKSATQPKLTGQSECVSVFAKDVLHREGPAEWESGEAFQEAVRNIWKIGTAANAVHPAIFPVALASRAIKLWSFKGDIILDPFLGSGTTMIAAEQLNRRCYGIEIEPKYVDVCCRRYLNQTGQSPVRESDGAKFVELADVSG